MITCTLINAHGVKRVVKLEANFPPYNLIANNKLYAVKPSWETVDDRLTTIQAEYNESFAPNVSDLLKVDA